VFHSPPASISSLLYKPVIHKQRSLHRKQISNLILPFPKQEFSGNPTCGRDLHAGKCWFIPPWTIFVLKLKF